MYRKNDKYSANMVSLAATCGIPVKELYARLHLMPLHLAVDPMMPFCRITNIKKSPYWYHVLYAAANYPTMQKITMRKVKFLFDMGLSTDASQVLRTMMSKGLVDIVGADLDSAFQYSITGLGRYVLEKLIPVWGEMEGLRDKAKKIPLTKSVTFYKIALKRLLSGPKPASKCFDSGRCSTHHRSLIIVRAGLAVREKGLLTITDAGRQWLKENA